MAQEKRNRSDTQKEIVGAAISPAELRRLGKAGLRGAADLAGAAMSRAERDRIRKALERAGSLVGLGGKVGGAVGKALSKRDKNSKSLTK